MTVQCWVLEWINLDQEVMLCRACLEGVTNFLFLSKAVNFLPCKRLFASQKGLSFVVLLYRRCLVTLMCTFFNVLCQSVIFVGIHVTTCLASSGV